MYLRRTTRSHTQSNRIFSLVSRRLASGTRASRDAKRAAFGQVGGQRGVPRARLGDAEGGQGVVREHGIARALGARAVLVGADRRQLLEAEDLAREVVPRGLAGAAH